MKATFYEKLFFFHDVVSGAAVITDMPDTYNSTSSP